jgi:peptide/nickel transport system substrate-binding protein
LFIVILLVGGCTQASQVPAGGSAQELRVGFPESNVPGADLGAGQFATLLSVEGLTNVAADGRAVPNIAERWALENDERRLRIRLRPDVLLHDGRPFSADLAVETVRTAVTRPANLARYPALADIASVRSDGDRDLVLELSRPSAWLPEDLTVPLVVGPDNIGMGPYRVVTRDPTKVVLERFDRYYLGRPSIARVVVTPFDTLRTAWASLLRGDVDVVSDVPADAVEFVRNEDVEVVSFARRYQFLIAFNSTRGPLRLPDVRRALNLAVNRTALLTKVLKGGGSPSTGPLWPAYWAYDRSDLPSSYDPARAASMLDAAGFRVSDRAGEPGLPPARLRFTCLVPEGFAVWERLALEVQRDLFNIGVDMQVTVAPFQEFNRLIGEGRFEAALVDMISGPTPGRAYMFWRSAREFRGLNVFGYENPEAERLFNVLRASTNEAAVRSATERLQRVLLDDPPALFLAWSERARAIRRSFSIPDEPGRDPMLSLWRWAPNASALQAAAR